MQIVRTAIPEVMIIEPRIFTDDRGFFLETYQQKQFDEAVGIAVSFVQDNHSGSRKNILRGLHYQVKQTQGKLVRVIAGSVYDVGGRYPQDIQNTWQICGGGIERSNSKNALDS
jgi:dTDP-4-dehydrorhamnose 3,5-epimerase